MRIKILLLFAIFALSSQGIAYAAEADLATNKKTEIVEVVQNETNNSILSYKNIVKEIVKTLNKRDSYFFEIRNPDDYIQYVKDLGVEVPENINQELTRGEFAVLLVSLTEKITNQNSYSTELIDINNIFTDLSDLPDDTVKAIETVFIEGLMDGKKNGLFAPNEKLSKDSFNSVLEKLKDGYSRKKLFAVVDSCFTNDERKAILEKYRYIKKDNETVESITVSEILNRAKGSSVSEIDVVLKKGEASKLMVEFGEYIPFEANSINSPVLIKDAIDYFNAYWKTPAILFRVDSNNNYHYLANNTSFLSNEEWEYLNTHLNSKITLSEFLILYDRARNLKLDMVYFEGFDSWEKVITYSENYLDFICPLIKNNKDCFDYFMNFDGENFEVVPYYFARTVHECQHEEFLSLAGEPFSRKRGGSSFGGTWSVSPRSDPEIFYYYDYTKGVWANSKMNNEMPETVTMFEHYPSNVKKDNKIEHYASNKDAASNSYGIQGLLSEFCSFALETKVQLISASLGFNKSDFNSLDYESYLKMELMVMDYLVSLQKNNPELYNVFVSDTDTVRAINNIMKDLHIIEELYPEYAKHTAGEKLLNWKKEIEKTFLNTKK